MWPDLADLLALPATPIRRWAVASQQHARRNAMLAATACADRRAIRDDVEAFLVGADRASRAVDLMQKHRIAAPG